MIEVYFQSDLNSTWFAFKKKAEECTVLSSSLVVLMEIVNILMEGSSIPQLGGNIYLPIF